MVSRVNQDKRPMVPAWTIQPASTRFDPPIQVTIPNSQGLKPGESSNIYQWDHDLATFVPIGRATVNEDASFLVTDAGSGVTKAGWGGGQPNPPLETCGKNAPPECTECQMLSTISKCVSCVPLAPAPTISITVSPEGDAEFLSSTTITATATLTGGGNSSKIKWEVTSLNGKAKGILAPTPASKTGGTFSFMADNVPSTTGIYTKTDPLKFEIKATYCTASATTTIEQDEKDIICQEYRDFTDNAVVHTCGGFCNGVFTFEPPSKGELNLVVGSTHFTQAELKTTEYNHTRGTPGTLADQVRSAYNSLINDDVQAKALGTTGLNETDVVVSPGAAMQVIGTTRVIGAVLETSACNGAPNPATCDDKVVGNTIVAGANGIAETVALNQPTNYGLKINSGWRNPRRNLIVNGAPQSKHLLGNAIDMKPVAYPPGKTKAMTFCILQKAAKQVASVGIGEILSRQVDCDNAKVTHVHTQ